jgi:hypothetical protein
MFGPGAYRPDPTEGITAIADLPPPPPEIVASSRTYQRQACPRCDYQAYRNKQFYRTLHDLGNLDLWCPRDLVVTYAQHDCTKCRKYFHADLSDLAPPGGQDTHRVIDLAVRLVGEDGLPYRSASWHLWRNHRVFVPCATIQNWVEAGGGKKRRRAWTRTSLPGRWLIFQGTWLPMSSMMAPSAYAPPSIIATTSASSLTS